MVKVDLSGLRRIQREAKRMSRNGITVTIPANSADKNAAALKAAAEEIRKRFGIK